MEELKEILIGKIPSGDLIKRWKYSVIIPTEVGYKILLGNEARMHVKTHILVEEIENKKEVKGQVAHPGKVNGKVKLVFGPQHNNKINEGDVLISTATSPQLLPAMKKSIAFVTDVGGITSHAAIVARELKKPCVVGTKYATQIFRDGDFVEVDADSGVVRIIKKAK